MKKPDINSLLNADNVNGAIIELDNYISALCSYGDELDRLTESQKMFYFNQVVEREVNNGGFDQYFYNSSGAFAHQTVESLTAIGAESTAGILIHAIMCFPGGKVPEDDEARRELLGKMSQDNLDVLEQLDQSFFAYEDDLNELNMAYVRRNREFF
ncbi:MAG: DMP19 family protein [Chitinophagaceae bacterium]|nr:DMP19 family protein [Chitinophagaceae bacterium]